MRAASLALVAAQVPNHLEQQRTECGQRQHEQLLRVIQQLVDQLCHQEAVLFRAAAQARHAALEGPDVIVVPVEELRQLVRVGRRSSYTGALTKLPQPAHPWLNSAPLLAPLLEAGFQRCEIRRPLVRGELRRQHFLRFQQACVEHAHCDANGFEFRRRHGRGLLARERLLSLRRDFGLGPGRGRASGLSHHLPHGIQGAVRFVECLRRGRALATFPSRKQAFERLALRFDLAEVDRAGCTFEAVRGTKNRLDQPHLLGGRGCLLQLHEAGADCLKMLGRLDFEGRAQGAEQFLLDAAHGCGPPRAVVMRSAIRPCRHRPTASGAGQVR